MIGALAQRGLAQSDNVAVQELPLVSSGAQMILLRGSRDMLV